MIEVIQSEELDYKSTEELIKEVNETEEEEMLNDAIKGIVNPNKLFKMSDCTTPDVIIKQSETHIFLMFEAKGIHEPFDPSFPN